MQVSQKNIVELSNTYFLVDNIAVSPDLVHAPVEQVYFVGDALAPPDYVVVVGNGLQVLVRNVVQADALRKAEDGSNECELKSRFKNESQLYTLLYVCRYCHYHSRYS